MKIRRSSIARRSSIVLACLLVAAQVVPAAAAAADANDKRIEPDGRDFTTGTGIVPTGSVQVEGGAAWMRGDEERALMLGDILLRAPLAQSVEIRLGVPSYLVRREPDRAAGFGDLTVGARFALGRAGPAAFAVQLTSELPTGARRVAERRMQPGGTVASTLTLAEGFELVMNLGAKRASQDQQRFTQTVAALSLQRDFSAKWNGFAELYAFNREEKEGQSRRYGAIGAVYFIDQSTALDARFGKGLNNGRESVTLISVGLSRRF